MINERERTYDEGEEQDDDEEILCEHCDEPLEEGETCGCRFCDECGEELSDLTDTCYNRCHMSEAEKKSDDLDFIGCEQSHADREEGYEEGEEYY